MIGYCCVLFDKTIEATNLAIHHIPCWMLVTNLVLSQPTQLLKQILLFLAFNMVTAKYESLP